MVLSDDRHFRGAGGIAELLPIAFPIIVSNASETAMMFVDRIFLAHLGKQHMAAAMIGGLSLFTTLSFFIGVMNYTNALVAQHLGSRQKSRCPVAVVQALYLVLISIPFMLLMIWVGPRLFALFGHAPVQLELETTYYRILLIGSVFMLGRFAFTGFFAGIGRTRIIMTSNIVAMVVNIGANYVLIFGKFGFPELGMAGAATGTIIGRLAALAMLAAAYFSQRNRSEYGTHRTFAFERTMFGKLLRFGLPAGIELMLNVVAFNFVVQILHSYGPDIAAAVTITFNWDLVAFIPMVGLNVAVMSLVGRYMGARDHKHAEKSAYSGAKLTYCYAAFMMLLFITIPDVLASAFAPDLPDVDYSHVLPLAWTMIRLAALYTLADATFLVFGGALRGAGDTAWIMKASVSLHWVMAIVLFVAVKVWRVPPLGAWLLFICFVIGFAVIALTRFRSGKWKQIQVVKPPPAPVPGGPPPNGDLQQH